MFKFWTRLFAIACLIFVFVLISTFMGYLISNFAEGIRKFIYFLRVLV